MGGYRAKFVGKNIQRPDAGAVRKRRIGFLFSEFIQGPWEILSSSLEVLGHDIPLGAKIDAMVSRAVHGLSQPGVDSALPPRQSLLSASDASQAETPAENAEGLILSGGGAYAAYEVGAIKALVQGKSLATGFAPWEPGILAGTSAGSLNASLLLSAAEGGLSAAEYLEHVWMNEVADNPGRCGSGVFRFRDSPLPFLTPGCYRDPADLFARFFRDNAFLARQFIEHGVQFLDYSVDIEQRVLETVDLSALICVDPLKALLRRSVHLDKIRASRKKLRIASTNWRTGEVRVFSNEEMTDEVGHKVIQASSSIPGIFPRVEIENDPYVDGGLVMNTPLKPAIDCGAEVLQVIFMDPEIAHIPLPRLPNTPNEMYRSLVIGFSATLKRDLEVAAKVNRGVEEATSQPADDSEAESSSETAAAFARGTQGDPHRHLIIHLHHPSQTLGGGWLSFGLEQIKETMQRGYEDVVQHNCKVNGCLLADR
jgi:NTE family protein